MPQGRNWSREERILAFNLYCRIPFGKMHSSNEQVKSIAQLIGRTSSAVAMKLVNFASLDPAHKKRNVKGLSNVSKGDKQIWDDYHEDWEALAFESQLLLKKSIMTNVSEGHNDSEFQSNRYPIETEREQVTRVRLIQSFFRETILSSYSGRCAVCAINLSELLIASHIIPWSESIERRADPRNGLCLCVMHDKAFDRGLIAFDSNFKCLLSERIRVMEEHKLFNEAFGNFENAQLRLPERFHPDTTALSWHRANIYLN